MAMTCDKCGQRVHEVKAKLPANPTSLGDARRLPEPPVTTLRPCGHTSSFTGTPETPTYPIR